MRESEVEAGALTAEEGWRTIQATVDQARSSMYVAGTSAILLLWGAIASLGYLSEYAIDTLASGFAASNPWISGPLWGVLATVGMTGSSIIGHRAGRASVAGGAIRSAGIRVFLFWLAVLAAAFLIPAAGGLWTADEAGDQIPRVAIGVIALGYVLFGIMHRPAIAVVGAGVAAAFYLPSYLAGDAAPAMSAGATLLVVAAGAVWIRRSGVA